MIIGTHDGAFHGDEIFAIAVLRNVLPVEKIIRTRDKDLLDTCDLKIDVGGGRFDHHMFKDRKYRANGVPYASFGLVWAEYGDKYIKTLLDDLYLKYTPEIVTEIHQHLDNTIVQQIDAGDNSLDVIEKSINDMKICDLFDIIFMENVQYFETYSVAKVEERFQKAITFAEDLMFKKTLHIYYGIKSKDIIRPLIEKQQKQGYLVLEEFIPFKTTINQLAPNGEIKFVIYPSSDGNWNIQAIQLKLCNRKDYHLTFPKEWLGKSGAALQEVMGCQDAVFCHMDGFLAVFKTKKAAIACAQQLITNENQ